MKADKIGALTVAIEALRAQSLNAIRSVSMWHKDCECKRSVNEYVENRDRLIEELVKLRKEIYETNEPIINLKKDDIMMCADNVLPQDKVELLEQMSESEMIELFLQWDYSELFESVEYWLINMFGEKPIEAVKGSNHDLVDSINETRGNLGGK